MENQTETKEESKETAKKPKPQEKYYRVRFSEKSSPNDTNDVELSVNGETLVIKRAVEVIIPARFKECADNATYPQFTQKPGKQRKKVGNIQIYPYQLIGEATKAQFDKMKREGNRQTKEFIKKYGFDGVPDED